MAKALCIDNFRVGDCTYFISIFLPILELCIIFFTSEVIPQVIAIIRKVIIFLFLSMTCIEKDYSEFSFNLDRLNRIL